MKHGCCENSVLCRCDNWSFLGRNDLKMTVFFWFYLANFSQHGLSWYNSAHPKISSTGFLAQCALLRRRRRKRTRTRRRKLVLFFIIFLPPSEYSDHMLLKTLKLQKDRIGDWPSTHTRTSHRCPDELQSLGTSNPNDDRISRRNQTCLPLCWALFSFLLALWRRVSLDMLLQKEHTLKIGKLAPMLGTWSWNLSLNRFSCWMMYSWVKSRENSTSSGGKALLKKITICLECRLLLWK